METNGIVDRRCTVRVPARATLVHRAVGMDRYQLCEVVSVSTMSLEILFKRGLAPGTLVTFLVGREGCARDYYRVVGMVQRREKQGAQWMHVIRACRRPWSPMFVYDLTYQAIARQGPPYSLDFTNLEASGASFIASTAPSPSAVIDAHRDQCLRPTASTDRHGNNYDCAVYRVLSQFVPFRDLNEMLRRFIACEQTMSRSPAGTILIERGSRDNVAVYLVDGILEMETFDGRKARIMAGTYRSQFPISQLRPHAYTVRTITDVSVLLINQEMVRKLTRIIMRRSNRPGIEVSEEVLLDHLDLTDRHSA